MANRNSTLTLDADTVSDIRNMLLVGLNAYGELMRLEGAVANRLMCGDTIHESLEPADITGDAETVSKFAEALRLLEVAA